MNSHPSDILSSRQGLIGITGATGMIGTQLLAEILEARPEAKIRCIVRHPRAHHQNPRVEYFCGDLLSEADCAEFVDGIETIIHLAQSNNPVASDRHWPSDCSANLIGTLNLLDALRALGRPIHLLFASSGGAVYGDHPNIDLYHEDLVCNPLSPYGIQKLAAEHYLRLGVAQSWLSACALRISNAYGGTLPAERRQGLVGVAVTRHLESQPLEIFGSLNTVRDYVHVNDVAKAFIKALDLRSGFHAINIASAQGHSVVEVLRMLGEVSKRSVQTRHSDFGSLQFALTPRMVLSNQKAAGVLGWTPQISLIEGIARLWNT